MSGKPSAEMLKAMNLVLLGTVPYRAAKMSQIALSTMYRSRLYNLWKDGQIATLKAELDIDRPKRRVTKLA
jgi:hypothetical protein